MAAAKPNVLILGGVNTYSRHLAALLVPENGESLVNQLRIVDKYSVMPATTYVGPQFPRILAKPNVEYHQVNLTIPEKVSTAFDPSEGSEAFEYVFDLTGEVRPERSEEIQIGQTCHVSKLCAMQAAQRKVKAYVRLQQPCYDCLDKGSRSEKDHQKPTSVWGIWWHETLRILADIPDLNLVILRVGLGYGPWVMYGYITPAIVLGRVYQFLKEKMSYLWDGSSPVHLVHSEDIASGLWECAKWMDKTGRKEAIKLAGEEIWFANDKNKVKGMDGMVDPSKSLVAPLFNLVDDSQETQEMLGETVAKYFGVEFKTVSTIKSHIGLKMNKDFIEDTNEMHMEAWASIITTSEPPVPNTPLSPYMDASMFAKPGTAFSNDKIKKILNYKLIHPTFTISEINAIVESFKEEGGWPIEAAST